MSIYVAIKPVILQGLLLHSVFRDHTIIQTKMEWRVQKFWIYYIIIFQYMYNIHAVEFSGLGTQAQVL